MRRMPIISEVGDFFTVVLLEVVVAVAEMAPTVVGTKECLAVSNG